MLFDTDKTGNGHVIQAVVKIVYINAPYQLRYNQNRNREAVVPAAVLEKLAWKLAGTPEQGQTWEVT